MVLEQPHGHAVLAAIERGAPLQIFEAKHSWGASPKEIIAWFWAGQGGGLAAGRGWTARQGQGQGQLDS